MQGVMVTVNHEIDFEKAQEIALDYDIIAEPRFRTVVNFIFGGSTERMRELAFGNQKVDFESSANFLFSIFLSDFPWLF